MEEYLHKYITHVQLTHKTRTMQKAKIKPKPTSNTPPAARRSHWAARMNDILDKNGGLTSVSRNHYEKMGLSDSILMQNKISNIKYQRSTVETASEFVTQLEGLINPSK